MVTELEQSLIYHKGILRTIDLDIKHMPNESIGLQNTTAFNHHTIEKIITFHFLSK